MNLNAIDYVDLLLKWDEKEVRRIMERVEQGVPLAQAEQELLNELQGTPQVKPNLMGYYCGICAVKNPTPRCESCGQDLQGEVK